MTSSPPQTTGPAGGPGARDDGRHDDGVTTERVVVGIDPGLTRCGWGVVVGRRARLRHVAHGALRTSTQSSLPARLDALYRGLEELLVRHRPDVVGVERVLFSRNVRTAMATGQAAGIALLAAQRAGVEVVELTPTSVKATVAGHGGADKEAVARMVAVQLGLDRSPTPADAADALAVAMATVVQGGPLAPPRATNTGAGNVADGGWEAHLARRGLDVVGGTGTTGRGA
jgi:crossover junction endodeoxyribonuclease RuvC